MPKNAVNIAYMLLEALRRTFYILMTLVSTQCDLKTKFEAC